MKKKMKCIFPETNTDTMLNFCPLYFEFYMIEMVKYNIQIVTL